MWSVAKPGLELRFPVLSTTAEKGEGGLLKLGEYNFKRADSKDNLTNEL